LVRPGEADFFARDGSVTIARLRSTTRKALLHERVVRLALRVKLDSSRERMATPEIAEGRDAREHAEKSGGNAKRTAPRQSAE
jgi:hypothetical protein